MREFNFKTILQDLRVGWRTPASFIAIALLFTLYTLHSAPTLYKVQMLVLPAPNDRAEVNPGAGGAIGTLLGAVGGGPTGSNYIRYQRLLSSPAVAQRLQDKYGMLQYVFAGSWDAQEKKWLSPPVTPRSLLLGWLFKLSHVPMSPPPDVTTLADYIQSQVEVMPSVTTDIVTVSMTSAKVDFAKRVLLTTHAEANAVLRDQVAHRASQQVNYLENKLAQTSVADYRQTLLALLQQQETLLMTTQTDASFAAEIISPPVASPTPVSPRPILFIAVAILVGGLVGSALVIFLGADWWRNAIGWMKARIASTKENAGTRTAPRT